MKQKRFLSVLLAAYLLVILLFTLNRVPESTAKMRLTLFWSYRALKMQWRQILGNILLFVPLGFLLRENGRSFAASLLFGFLLSCGIELVQLIGRLGLCELDDVFHNTLGTALGCGLYAVAGRFHGE